MPRQSLAVLIVGLLASATALAEQVRTEEKVSEFLKTINPTFLELKEASREYVEFSRGLTIGKDRDSVHKRLEDARNRFETIVNQDWPFSGSEDVKSRAGIEAEGMNAYRKASKFEEDMYHTLKVSREVAVEKYIEVANTYPGTRAHDLSLNMAAHLYVQRLLGSAKADYVEAEKLWRQLIASSDPSSSLVVRAQENIASLIDDPVKRMEARSDLYFAIQSNADDVWLYGHVLTPSADMQRQQYIDRASGFLIQLQTTRCTNGQNMVSDAFQTKKPLERLNWLRSRHKGDVFLEAEIDKAIAYAAQREFGYDPVKAIDAAIEDFTLPHAQVNPPPVDISKRMEPVPIEVRSSERESRAFRNGSRMWLAILLAVGIGVSAAIVVLIVKRRSMIKGGRTS